MLKLKKVYRLGDDIVYKVEYTTIFKTYKIGIYYDISLNTLSGAMRDGNACQDIGHDKALIIMSELLKNTKEGA